MSAMPVDSQNRPTDTGDERSGETLVAGTPVVVRRHAGVAALVGAAASAVAIAYLWRASLTMTALDWALCAVMATVAAVYLASLVDARTPLVVADDLGVRIRLGREWRGLPWDAIGEVSVHPRRVPLRDGRLVFAPHSLARALDGLDARGRRHARLNQKMYGGALAVPLGLTTRVSSGQHEGAAEEPLSLAAALAVLARGRSEVVEVAAEPATERSPEPASKAARSGRGERPAQADDPAPSAATRTRNDTTAEDPGPVQGPEAAAAPAVAPDTGVRSTDEPETPDRTVAGVSPAAPEGTGTEERSGWRSSGAAGRAMLGGIGTIVSRVAKSRRAAADHAEPGSSADDAPDGGDAPAVPAAAEKPAVALPLRETRRGSRAEVTRDIPATLGNAALHEDLAGQEARPGMPEARELRRPGSVDLVFEPADSGRVRPISTLGDPVEPLVIDDFVTEPAYDPVIGPEITAARTRLGLSVDELADRTRIRPHVIESIEVDDFAPCGGDFYARGHLRTLARVLGKDVTPMLAQFEERYATAPISARRVFEAELATGMTGSMRSTVGGPNWGLLAGVVLSLVLVWGVVRLFAAEPAEIIDTTAPVLNGSAGVGDSPVVPAPGAPAVEPLEVRLTATQTDTRVQVRDGNGEVVFRGLLVLGERKTVQAAPPVRVRAVDAYSIEVSVNGRDRGLLGTTPGEPARRTFRAPR